MIFLAVAAFPIVPKTLYGAARLCHRHTCIIYQYQRLRPQPKPLEGGLTRYISTRGEAPTLSFCDVMLTGLARDGGLYVPETWPQLSPETIAGFFGRPYWEVAVDVIRPFVGDEIADADLGRMANEAYATFRHPAVVPLRQIGPHQFLLELFHGPTLAFKDVAMQLISRLMDHVLAQRARHTTIVVATSGDTGGAAVDAFAGLDNVDLIVLFPNGRISDVQRRMMTTTGAANVHALAIEGTFDDCQAIVKGLFNHHDFRDEVSLSGVNSINWARIVAQVVYYFTSAVALGAPARTVDFTVPTGNFGDIFAGFVAKRMGHDWGTPSAEDVWNEVRSLSPQLRGMTYARLNAGMPRYDNYNAVVAARADGQLQNVLGVVFIGLGLIALGLAAIDGRPLSLFAKRRPLQTAA